MAGIEPVQLIAHAAVQAKTATATVQDQTTAGNMLVAAWRSGSGATLTNVTDTQDTDGTAWTIVQQSGGGNATSAIAIRPLVNTLGPTDTVSFTGSLGSVANDFTVWEYSGIDLNAPFETGVGTSGTSKSTISDTITPPDPTDGLFAAVGTGTASATATDTDGIFTARGVDTDGINLFDVLPAGTTDPVTGSWALSPSTNVGLVIVALKAAATGGNTQFNDSPTGSLSLSGAASQSKRASDNPSATLSLSGVTVEQDIGRDRPSGALSFRGSTASSHVLRDAPVGAFVLTGRLNNSAPPQPLLPTRLLIDAHSTGLLLDAGSVGLLLDANHTGLTLND